MRFFGFVRLAAGTLVVLTACTPLMEMPPASPDGPRISSLTLDPPEAVAGCLVTLRFQFETHGAEIAGGRVRWSVAMGRRPTNDSATLEAELFESRESGQATLVLRLRKVGRYHYVVQIEDSEGRRSNVLEQDMIVEVPWAPGTPRCTPGG